MFDISIMSLPDKPSKGEEYKRMSTRGRWDWDRWSFWSYLRIRNKLIQEMIAECLGTFILCTFGNGAVAQSVLSRGKNGGFISVNFAYGMGVTMAAYLIGSISGGHINPAVSLAMTIAGKLRIYAFPAYVLAQVLGGFLSSALLYSVYYDAIHSFSPTLMVEGPNATAGIFATYPQSFLSIGNGLWDQIFATGLLVLLVFAITDETNNKMAPGLAPVSIGFIVLTIGLSFGYNCGYAINPARDFGPRLFTLIAGWGTKVFWAGNTWFWVPIVGPFIGGVLGAFTYKILVNIQLEARKEGRLNSRKYVEQVNITTMDGNELASTPTTPVTPTGFADFTLDNLPNPAPSKL